MFDAWTKRQLKHRIYAHIRTESIPGSGCPGKEARSICVTNDGELDDTLRVRHILVVLTGLEVG